MRVAYGRTVVIIIESEVKYSVVLFDTAESAVSLYASIHLHCAFEADSFYPVEKGWCANGEWSEGPKL